MDTAGNKRQGNESDGGRGNKKPRTRSSNPTPAMPKGKQYDDIQPHNVIRSVDKIRPGEVLEACPAVKARYHSDLAFVFEHGYISEPKVAAMYDQWYKIRKSDLVDQYWASHMKNRTKIIKPSTIRETLRTLLTLSNMILQCSSAQQPEVYRELLVLRMDYIMLMCALFCTLDLLENADRPYPDYRTDFAKLVEALEPQGTTVVETTQQADVNQASQEAVADLSSGGGVTLKPAPRSISAASPCPGVSLELYDRMQALRVKPGSQAGLESIIGCAEGKEMIEDILLATIDHPVLAKTRQLDRGVLLYGPPGTGKTSRVLAAASQPRSPTVYIVSSAALSDQYHGNSEKNIVALYAVAAYHAPAIIFIDEVDSLCAKRRADESATIKNMSSMLLVGMSSCPANVVTIGATNIPENIDTAFLSRLETHINVPLPSQKELKDIWKLKVSTWPQSVSQDEFSRLSEKTPGFSGRDVEAAARQARKMANRGLKNSPAFYRRYEQYGEEHLVQCSAGDPAACAINGDAGIIARLQGRPTTYQDSEAVLQKRANSELLFC